MNISDNNDVLAIQIANKLQVDNRISVLIWNNIPLRDIIINQVYIFIKNPKKSSSLFVNFIFLKQKD